MPKLQIPRKIIPLVQKKKRYKILIGGRGSAKSTSIADICLMDSQVDKLKIGCFREFQNSIEDSVHSLLCDEIERLELQGFNPTKNEITNSNGGLFRYRGLARNIMSVQSMAGYQRFWIEEAHTLSKESIKVLFPTIREDDSEIWMSANPQSRQDPFSQRFLVPYEKELTKNGYYEDDLHLIIVVNYTDNPWFPDVLEQERLHDKEALSLAEYEHIWLGKYNDSVENALIQADWFDAAIDAHVKLGFKPQGVQVVSHDPSDTGADAKGMSYRHGNVFLDVQEKTTGDVNEGCDWATDYAIEVSADLFVWDCDGLGVTLRRQVQDAFKGKKIDFYMFKGSEGVENSTHLYQPDENLSKSKAKTNKQTFRNKRAQYCIELRDRYYNAYRAVIKGEYIDPDKLISLSSDIDCLDQLRAETCRVPLVPNGRGLFQVMDKAQMKTKLKVTSPNLFDSTFMNLKNPELQNNTVTLNFASRY